MHDLDFRVNAIRTHMDWLHALMQELEEAGVSLPMGDYNDAYEAIETVRDAGADLLEACRLSVLLEDEDVHEFDTRWKQARKMMRAAIAQAEGRKEVMSQCIVVVGNLAEGFRFVGPFADFDSAAQFSDGFGADHWIATLEDSLDGRPAAAGGAGEAKPVE